MQEHAKSSMSPLKKRVPAFFCKCVCPVYDARHECCEAGVASGTQDRCAYTYATLERHGLVLKERNE